MALTANPHETPRAFKESYEEHMNASKKQLAELIANKETAQTAPRGAEIHCANCGKPVKKNNYQTTFCSNVKTHGKDNCKDKWHNRVKGLRYTLKTEA